MTYVLLTSVALIYISFLSFGLPTLGPYDRTPSLTPFPLSYPFHSINAVHTHPAFPTPGPYNVIMIESYELHFMTSKIAEVWENPLRKPQFNYVNDLFFFYCYFLMVNLAGAVLGFGLSKAKSIWRYFGRRKPETETTSNELEK